MIEHLLRSLSDGCTTRSTFRVLILVALGRRSMSASEGRQISLDYGYSLPLDLLFSLASLPAKIHKRTFMLNIQVQWVP